MVRHGMFQGGFTGFFTIPNSDLIIKKGARCGVGCFFFFSLVAFMGANVYTVHRRGKIAFFSWVFGHLGIQSNEDQKL